MTPDVTSDAELGQWAHNLARELWTFPRSLTGHGVRKTLDVLQRELPGLKCHSVPTGYHAFDWEVPREWNLNRAWIETPDGLGWMGSGGSGLVSAAEPFGWMDMTSFADSPAAHEQQAREDPNTYPAGHWDFSPFGRIRIADAQYGSFCLTLSALPAGA